MQDTQERVNPKTAGFKCRLCPCCNGKACTGELPGMGGVSGNSNFKANYEGWEKAAANSGNREPVSFPEIWLAPMTGAVENIGYHQEREYYFDMVNACAGAGINITIGDGVPDEKFLFGLEALKKENVKGGIFIKPYSDENIFERMEKAVSCARLIGIDIDAYSIVTMRNLAKLEKKSVSSLKKIQDKAHEAGLPFAVKGIFLPEEKELLEELHPDIAVISNHGGRIETRPGNTADFLSGYAEEFSPLCGELWVDGGLRTSAHIKAAGLLGAKAVMIGRPFVSALLSGGAAAVKKTAENLSGENRQGIL